MERGPMALFGAIVAVGLGPALWLGAQFGTVAVSPNSPPAVIVEQKQDAGGAAGSAPEDPVAEVGTRPRSQIKRLSATPSARPSTSATSEAPGPQDEDDTTTPPAKSPEPTKSDKPSTPPTDDTTEPTVPSTGDDDDTEEPGPEPPETPDTDDDTQAAGAA